MPQLANQIRANPLWFSGICDELYRKIAVWDQAYWHGEVHSTRQWLNPKSGQIEDKPTRCAHNVPIRLPELDHLIRIVEALRPNSPLLGEIQEIKKVWRYGKPVQGFRYNHSYWGHIALPTGIHRIMNLAFYPEHVKELLDILKEAKTGQKTATIDAAVAAKKAEGKDLFEE